jgi:outer membrane protein assembly factor BamB
LDTKGGIFLSYRREETGHVAGRLADHLIARFGEHEVFMDVDSIPPGVDFVDLIQRAVQRCDVLLVLIGREWASIADEDGQRRLDNPDDFVVLEVRAALDRGIPVVPVLVDGARPPRPEDLPESLRPLVRRNAVRVGVESFRSDVDRMIEQLADVVQGDAPTPATGNAIDNGEPALPGHRPISRRALLGGIGGTAALAVVGAGVWGGRTLLLRPPRPVWTFQTDGEIYSSPTIAGGLLYIGSNDNNLYALDAHTGRIQWRFATGGAVTSTAAFSNGVVYVGSNDFYLYAVNAVSGRLIWRFKTGGILHSSPAVAGGTVYVGSRDNTLYAIDTGTGKQRWGFHGQKQQDMVIGFNSSPTVVDGAVYVGCRDHNVYAIDAAGGFQRWRRTTNSTVDSSAAVSGSTVVIGSDDHNLWALRTADGVPIWMFSAQEGIVSTPRLGEGVVYVGSGDGNLYAIDSDTGRPRWRFPTGDMVRSSPVVASDVVIVGSRDFSLYAVDRGTGLKRWSFPTGGPIDDSSPRVADGIVYVGSLDRSVYALDAARGARA